MSSASYRSLVSAEWLYDHQRRDIYHTPPVGDKACEQSIYENAATLGVPNNLLEFCDKAIRGTN
jgi:hypothetical protein